MIESYLAHLRAMGSTEEEIIQARFDVWKRHTDDWKKGMEIGVAEFKDSLGTETAQWADITDNAFQSMRNTAGDFASALMWDFDNIGESFRNMLKQMAMDITRTLVQRSVIDPLVGMLSGAVGGLLGGGSGVGSDIFGGMFDTAFGGAMPWHSGGIVPKYHAGGRVPGTGSSLGILQGGEYVIPRLHEGALTGKDFDESMLRKLSLYNTPTFPNVNIPSGPISKWDVPQLGFYGSELMNQYGIGVKPGVSTGMPGSYYEKYGSLAEPRYLSQLLTGGVSDKLMRVLEYSFAGGLPTALGSIFHTTSDPHMTSPLRQHAGEFDVGAYGGIMKALSGVGTGQSPWLSMLPGVASIPYPKKAVKFEKELARSLGHHGSLFDKRFSESWPSTEKHHSGGLLADEQMAILQAGEAVIPKKSVSMNRELIDSLISGGGKRFHEGGMVGQGSSSPSITINVENRGSNPVNVTSGPTVVSQGRIIATMVIDEIRRNPNMRNALR
jgi:hypothetical protein